MLIDNIGQHELVVRTSTGLHAVDVSQTYPDTMPLMEKPEGPFFKMLLRPRSLASFMAAMFWVDAIRERGVPPYYIELLLPCVPGARQDRLNDEGDFLFTAKSIAREINMRHFANVTVLDPHSDVISALIDRCTVVPAKFIGPRANEEYIDIRSYRGVIAPDGGAVKRASVVAKECNLSLYHAWKARDVATGRIYAFGTQPLEPGIYLVVDDLCDAGGTFLGLATVLHEQDCRADLYVTHGLFTKGTSALLQLYGRIFTTDSTVGPKEGVTVITRCATLLGGQQK